MTTAKELTFKAYSLGYKGKPEELNERFNNWWEEWFIRQEHKDSFYHKHNVYIDGKRYIQAE